MSGASIWTGNTTQVSTANADSTKLEQRFVPTEGQSLFVLTTFSYSLGTHSLEVFINGVRQVKDTDFTETSVSSFTVTGGVEATDVVDAVGILGTTGAILAAGSAAAAAASATASAASAALASALIPGNLPLSVANGGTGQITAVKGLDALTVASAPVASAANTNLDTVTGDYIHITGSVGITSFTLSAGKERTLVFDGAPLISNSANITLPGGVNFQAAAGDTLIVRAEAANVIKVVSTNKGNGLPPVPAGMVLLAPLNLATTAVAVNALNVFSALYDSYVIIGEGLAPAADDRLQMQFAVAGTLITTLSYATTSTLGGASTPFGAAAMELQTAYVTVAVGAGINFDLQLDNVNSAVGVLKSGVSRASFEGISGNFRTIDCFSGYKGGVVTGIGFSWVSASNFKAQGSIRIYGIQKA